MQKYHYPESMKTIFSQDFENATEVSKAGGVLTGSPVVKNGLVCTGTEYASFEIPNTLLSHERISFVCRFTSGFALLDGQAHGLFWTNDPQRYAIIKWTTGNLYGYLGNALVCNLAPAAYTAYWNTNQENVIILSGQSGANKMYLNGTLINSSATAWTPKQPTSLEIGRFTASPFLGTIHSLSIHSCLFDAQDVACIQNNSLFNYMDKADVWLDMSTQTAIPNRTNLLVDGDMEAAGVGAWHPINSTVTKEAGTRTGGHGTQVLRVAYLAAGSTYAYQSILTIGKTYRVAGWARGDGTFKPLIYDGAGHVWTGTTSTDWQYFDVLRTAGHAWLGFWTDANAAGYVEFDDISVQLVETQTTDSSGFGRNFLLGDGTTAASFPTFLNPSFRLDGATDYLSRPGSVFNNDEQTAVFAFRPNAAFADGVARQLLHTSGSTYRFVKSSANTISIQFGGTTLFSYGAAEDVPKNWIKGMVNVLIITGKSGNNRLYWHGKMVDSNTTAWSPGLDTACYLGRYETAINFLSADFLHFSTYPFMLSSIQVKDATTRLLRGA